ncbi:MAG: ATP-dependent DNA helicase RecG [Clostridia bacterium]|nr:ATP-dependent DNA helicase RecG [Clostridia bacterium]
MASLFELPITHIKGIGENTAQLFHKLGVYSVGQLLCYYPRTYEDWSNPVPITPFLEGNVLIKARLSAHFITSRLTAGRFISKAQISDDSGSVELIYFNNKYISSMLKEGEEYYFFGKVERDLSGLKMIAPTFSPVGNALGLHPVYSLTAGLTNKNVQRFMKEAIKLLPEKVNDPLPSFIRQKYKLCNLKDAMISIHFPKSLGDMQKARFRLTFEELLTLNLGLRMIKSHKNTSIPIHIPKDFSQEFVEKLPFTPTNAQLNAIKDCMQDITKGKYPMNRLIQGDVGSGKTAVSAAVCYSVAKCGLQSAFMAPTEILAEQHFKTLTKFFENSDIRVVLLTGSMKDSQKKNTRKMIESGEAQIVVGTHALITDKTVFYNLALAVTDEQHRFGVAQRTKLLSKGNSVHLLVMSATPIPRTMGLVLYGDLDVSVIDELPKGRQKIKTMLIDSSKRERAFNFIRSEIEAGRQAYIVCPLVEEGELSLASAEEYAAELMLSKFPDLPVGIIHGKMKSADKESTMRKFAEGEIKLLVATTVIEVGVDVPNASVMMIENAERFGLSQLHQLRGRVGRGSLSSYCILVSDNKSEESARRLSIMCSTDNGFVIADEDLKLRGPGDFFGSRQHGLPQLNIADLSDFSTLFESSQAAMDILDFSPDMSSPELKGLRGNIKRLFKTTGTQIN